MTTTPEPTKQVPRIEGNPAPTLRADHNDLADWVRDHVGESVPTVQDLPTTGTWVGRVIYVVAARMPYTYQSSQLGWVPRERVFRTAFLVTSDANGLASVTHNLGGVPDYVSVTLSSGSSDSITLIQDCVVWDTQTNTLRLRFIRRDTNQYFASNPFRGFIEVRRNV